MNFFNFNKVLSFSLDNKRLDEWVSIDRLDLDRLQPPKADEKKKGPSGQEPVTPVKSQSPEREIVNGGPTVNKKAGSSRKRKLIDEVS